MLRRVQVISRQLRQGGFAPTIVGQVASFEELGVLLFSGEIIVQITFYQLRNQPPLTPRFLMFVNGKTGSLKTALCSVLFNLTGEAARNIPAIFRDSVASVEAKFPQYCDQVLLLDDYSPATTARNKADMNKLLEDVMKSAFRASGLSSSE